VFKAGALKSAIAAMTQFGTNARDLSMLLATLGLSLLELKGR
jgi:hypothetical protein